MRSDQYDDRIRFTTINELGQYLENVGEGELSFRAYPISGTPEDFHYNGEEQSVVRVKDQRTFDNVEDFTCYAFQCDPEGYSHTEYVDVEILES